MESLDNIEKDIKTTENFETQTEIRNQKFQIVNQIGIIYALGTAFMSQLAEIYHTIMKKIYPGFSKKRGSDYILVGTLIINQLFGTLTMFILTKFIKKLTFNKKAYGYKKYIANLIINSGLLIFGSIIGYFVNNGFLFIFYDGKNSSNEKLQQITSGSFKKSNKFLNFFVVCISAPIAEEFIFRKFLIDRLMIYSKTLAIFASGILFGIFHNNIPQFFGAMFLGWSLAYSYVETGNILIPISYHIFENSYTTLIQILASIDSKTNKTLKIIQTVLFSIRLIEALAGIIILIIKRKKIKVTGEENKSGDKWKLFKSYGMWIFFVEGFIMFSILYMNILFVIDTPNTKNSRLFFVY